MRATEARQDELCEADDFEGADALTGRLEELAAAVAAAEAAGAAAAARQAAAAAAGIVALEASAAEEAAQAVALDEEAAARRSAAAEVGPGRFCSPRHHTHFEPSFIELNSILR